MTGSRTGIYRSPSATPSVLRARNDSDITLTEASWQGVFSEWIGRLLPATPSAGAAHPLFWAPFGLVGAGGRGEPERRQREGPSPHHRVRLIPVGNENAVPPMPWRES